MSRGRILLIDDEDGIRFAVKDFLENAGYEVEEASRCSAAIEAFQRIRPDAVFADYLLPDGNALELLARLKEIDPEVPVTILTGHGSIDLAVRAIKEGAEQFLTKPIELPALLLILRRLLENARNRQKQLAGKARQTREAVNPFIGRSPAVANLAEQVRKVVGSDSPILIQGETGAGKGVLARWIHENGPRADEAFVELNCAGLSREFLETELFGHEKGAFTGAVAAKQGLLEFAHRGSVFLDEIGDMDLLVQPKLLKALEEKRIRRMGSVRDRPIDIRLIAATHQDLGLAVKEKRFRSDLYFRISTIPLSIPPLRQRSEDILLLATHFLERLSADMARGAFQLSPEAGRALCAHSWPGNIRELRNVLERAVLLSEQSVLSPKDLRFDIQPGAAAASFDGDLTLAQLEQAYIKKVLAEENGKVEQAARRLGIPRSSLYQKLKQYQSAESKG